MGYFWVRVFEYIHERDSEYDSESNGKGVLLDEFYLKDVEGGREEVKNIVRERYCGRSSVEISFKKPRNKNGLYAIVMDSQKFYYDRFYYSIDTYCFWHTCYKPIKGKASEFPRVYMGSKKFYEQDYDEFKDSVYFCSQECKANYYRNINPLNEGVFQSKEVYGGIYGYVYYIYNRSENVYYIGQTRYMPFFRWQEHVKDKKKGDIKDLSFGVLTELNRNINYDDEKNQEYLNSIEAWWISKHKEEGYKVFNISNPKISISDLKIKFNEMVAKNNQLSLIIEI